METPLAASPEGRGSGSSPLTSPALQARDLVRTFGPLRAVDGLSLIHISEPTRPY